MTTLTDRDGNAVNAEPFDDPALYSENIQMICGINNRTGYTLKVKSKHLDWGKFDDKPNFHPKPIPRLTAMGAFRSSGAAGTATGTEGTVVYEIDDKSGVTIHIHWDVPYRWGASNDVKVWTTNEDVAVEVTGFNGKGAVEDILVKVVDGRPKKAARS